MQTPAEFIRNTDDTLSAERRCFVEEQNVRRSLGPALWTDLCDEIQTECSNINGTGTNRMTVSRNTASMTIRDSRTGQSLQLEYNAGGPCVDWRVSGGAVRNIAFQIVNGPVPSLIPFINGPVTIKDAAMDLIMRLVRH